MPSRSPSTTLKANRYLSSCTTASRVVLRKLGASYDPTDAAAAYNFIEGKLKQNEYVTGLIHIMKPGGTEFHAGNNTSAVPLNRIPYEKLSPAAPPWRN